MVRVTTKASDKRLDEGPPAPGVHAQHVLKYDGTGLGGSDKVKRRLQIEKNLKNLDWILKGILENGGFDEIWEELERNLGYGLLGNFRRILIRCWKELNAPQDKLF